MEHVWTEEPSVDEDGREWQQACANCGMRRRTHVTPKGNELEVLDSIDGRDCAGHIVRAVMKS